MGASQGGGGIAAGDGSDILGGEQQNDEVSGKKKLLNVGVKAAAGALQGMNQGQQQMVPAGPQLGAGVTQAPQAQDPYQEYLLKLQQQQQTPPFFGN